MNMENGLMTAAQEERLKVEDIVKPVRCTACRPE